MKPKWLSFEDQVRDIASLTYGRRCDPGRIAGADIDGIVDNDELSKTLIEITTNTTLEKVRSDIVKLTGVRGALSLGSHSGRNPSDFSRILASAFDSLDSL